LKTATHALALALVLAAAPAAAQEDAAPEEGTSQADEQMQNGGVTEERDLADDQARAHFRAGRSLYDLGQFGQAAQEFESAYRLAQRPELLFNAYVAYRDANDLEGAVRSLGAYLDLVQDAPDRVNLQARLASMSQALQAQRAREAELAAERNRPAGPPPPPEGPAVWPWIVMGLGSAMVVGGIVTGAAAVTEADALAAECPNNLCSPMVRLDSRRGTVESLGIATDVLLFGGGAIAVLGLVLGIVLNSGSSPAETTSEPSPEEPELTAGCGPTGCAGSLRMRF
jgi:tetratricopeptide (TPR) repeat protein